MIVTRQKWMFEGAVDDSIIKRIEQAGRTCYKTDPSDDPKMVNTFIRARIMEGHESILEHGNISVRIITDRGVTHEIVRHRLASYSQESTRFCNYAGSRFGSSITVILPVWFYDDAPKEDFTIEQPVKMNNQFDTYALWLNGCLFAEDVYMNLISISKNPNFARSVLPNSLKTEIVMTCNIREWRHFFTLRTSMRAHPQMRQLAMSMLEVFRKVFPVLFEDIKFDGFIKI